MQKPKPSILTIGELSRRTGLATSALRYYERVGLLRPDSRANGRRYYDFSGAERVALIRLCQDAGFTLAEIRGLLATGTRRSRAWTRLVKAKLSELEASIARARRAQSLIQHALACRHRDLATCPNFRSALDARLSLKGRHAIGHRVGKDPLTESP
jgi:DNA-binding transcriptional MerR regulator